MCEICFVALLTSTYLHRDVTQDLQIKPARKHGAHDTKVKAGELGEGMKKKLAL